MKDLTVTDRCLGQVISKYHTYPTYHLDTHILSDFSELATVNPICMIPDVFLIYIGSCLYKR